MKTKVSVIETERLLLRIPRLEDVDGLAAIYSDAQVMQYIGSGSTRTKNQTEVAILWMRDQHHQFGFGLWIATLKSDQQIIGRCGLIQQEIDGQFEVEVAYLLGKEFWGKGYATEAAMEIRNHAFTNGNISRLISLINPDNSSSARVAEKIGMQFERQVKLSGISANLYAIGKEA